LERSNRGNKIFEKGVIEATKYLERMEECTKWIWEKRRGLSGFRCKGKEEVRPTSLSFYYA